MILCNGEALIDMLPRQTAADESAFAPHSGGAVFNTSIALSRLGVKAGIWCGLSDDLFGQQLQQDLQRSGVDFSLAPIASRPTTLAFISLRKGQAQYAFYDENTAARMVTEQDLPTLGDIEIEALFFGGISLVSEPCGSVLESFLLRESSSRVIMLDPNIRQGFIKGEAAYRTRLDTMMSHSDIVKLSDEDAAWLFGEAEPEIHAARMLDMGIQLAIITEGAKGATAFSHHHTVSVPAPKVSVVDTVGAGDSFNAGILEALKKQGVLKKPELSKLGVDQLEAILSRAVEVAAVTVSRAGANSPWLEELAK
ncbi:carbohydrate kinase family protein [Halomonas sp. BC04]|uniref:carbohydrate kinase family protein n=1 Tax=Halomonas sp. BC04 TaxID=1403540 RepID=UPI0003ED79D2|nr:carbohydrate kinase [Halomonas sp. BC04]EWH02654.1 carbohydrate kinase [Halomonas sp. BC04]